MKREKPTDAGRYWIYIRWYLRTERGGIFSVWRCYPNYSIFQIFSDLAVVASTTPLSFFRPGGNAVPKGRSYRGPNKGNKKIEIKRTDFRFSQKTAG